MAPRCSDPDCVQGAVKHRDIYMRVCAASCQLRLDCINSAVKNWLRLSAGLVCRIDLARIVLSTVFSLKCE